MRLTRGIVPLVIVAIVAGCGGTASKTAASGPPHSQASKPTHTKPSPTPPPIPTPPPPSIIEPPQITVGLPASCELLFNRPLAKKAIALVRHSPLTVKDYRQAGVLASAIDDIAVRAKPTLRPYLDAMSSALAAIHAQTGATVDLRDFQAAGLELITRCTPYIR